MKPLFTFLLLSVLLNAKSFAQKSDSLRLIHLNHLQKELSINSVKAQQVLAIQEKYKKQLKSMLTDASILEADKQRRFQLLVDDKNLKLKSLLTEEQFKRVVPTTEIKEK